LSRELANMLQQSQLPRHGQLFISQLDGALQNNRLL
jgi:hypothetical protein